MPSYSITFDVRRPDTIEFPAHLLQSGRYELRVGEGGGVELTGNRDGLLYLAEVLVRFAIGGYVSDFHAHLPLNSDEGGPNVDSRPELTIYAPDGS